MKKNALNEETTKLCQETNLFDEIFDLYMIVREHFLVLGVNIETINEHGKKVHKK